jgi:zinc/manganese transport system substrate-binding protein/manganese/iron transport system substrate-binding protein
MSGRIFTTVVAAAVALLVGAGCGDDDDEAASLAASTTPASGAGVLEVVTTTTQITDFATVIGGDHVKVYSVLKANVDPHDYEPTPADLDAIAKADVIVKNGVGLEKWFDDRRRQPGCDDPRGQRRRGGVRG